MQTCPQKYVLLALAAIFTLLSAGWAQGPVIFSSTAPVTLQGNVTATAGQNQITFTGPSPWIDVTADPYNVICDGATHANNTAGFQSALNAAALFQSGSGAYNGGTVFIPSGMTGACVVSSLNMDNMIGVTVRAGMGGGMGINAVPTIKFTGTCTPAACLSMRSADGVNFYGVVLSFPNATGGPFVDLKHCATGAGCRDNDAAYDGFHAVHFVGPGSTVGPIVNLQQVDFIAFDQWTMFSNASVFITGPTSNVQFSDNVDFDQVIFHVPGTAAVQNASVNWSVARSEYVLTSGSGNCHPFLQYVNGYNQESNFTFRENGFSMSGGCTNSVMIFTFPAVNESNGFQGGANFSGNLLLGSGSFTSGQTLISLGNNQAATISGGNLIANWGTFVSIGTGVRLDVGSNAYPPSTITTFLSGTPAAGKVTNPGGLTTVYGGGLGVAGLRADTIQITGLNTANPNFSMEAPLLFNVVPGISSGFGTSPSITSHNGTTAFTVNVGTGGTASSGVIALPTAASGWNCTATDITTQSATVFITKQIASSPTSATIANFNASGAEAAWAAGDILSMICVAR